MTGFDRLACDGCTDVRTRDEMNHVVRVKVRSGWLDRPYGYWLCEHCYRELVTEPAFEAEPTKYCRATYEGSGVLMDKRDCEGCTPELGVATSDQM